jgi:methyl-accepting chemotaxis protein
MDFDDATKAHSAWKLKLGTYLTRPDGSIKSAEVSADNRCALGQWNYGEGLADAHLPDFVTLKDMHKKFHGAAAEVILKADSGQSVTEDIALGAVSDFGAASQAVVVSLMRLKATMS